MDSERNPGEATLEDNLRAAHQNFVLMQRDNVVLAERQERLIKAISPYYDVLINAHGHMKLVKRSDNEQ